MKTSLLISDDVLSLLQAQKILHKGDKRFSSAAQVLEAFHAIRANAVSMHRAGEQPYQVLCRYSQAADTLVQGFYQVGQDGLSKRFAGSSSPHALVAVGGYGRREMAPYSDLDLLFLVRSADNAYLEALAEAVIYPLWDCGLVVGYSIRTPQQAVSYGNEDLSIWTAMMDHRYLAGDVELYQQASSLLRKNLYSGQVEKKLREKWIELDKRRKANGGTVFLLEPNVKEATGGLRDLHTLEWCVHATQTNGGEDWHQALHILGRLQEDEMSGFRASQDFLWALRTEIHLQSEKKNDVLQLEIQDATAAALGIEASRINTRSERLMTRYFETARNVSIWTDEVRPFFETIPRHRKALYRMSRRTIDGYFFAMGGEITLREGVHLQERPELAIRLLRVAAETEQRLAYFLARNVHRLVQKKNIWRSAEVKRAFLQVFESRVCGDTLEILHRYEVLPRVMREFQHLWCRMQHDAYHSYTTDIHLIQCVKAYDNIKANIPGEFPAGLRQALDEIEDQATMRLAVFLHDVGKGYNKDHSVFGAELCRSIGRRFGMPAEQTKRIMLLTRIHLLMSHTAQRADIHDPQTVRKFCEEVGDLQNLSMLYVLTVCDQMGVSGGLLTPWKLKLMDQLFMNAHRMMSSGDTRGRWIESKVRARRKEISAMISRDADTYSGRILRFGPRYFLGTDTETMAEHARFLKQGEDGEPQVLLKALDDGLLEIWITGPEIRGIFSSISAVLYQMGLDVLATDAYVPQDTFLFNMFVVRPIDDYFAEDARKKKRLQEAIISAFKQEVVVEVDVDQKRLQTLAAVSSRVDLIRWDNNLSETSTVIEVDTWDRIGLLHIVSRIIFEQGFNIVIAKVETRGGRVNDQFHIRTPSGEKVYDLDRLDALVLAVRERLVITPD